MDGQIIAKARDKFFNSPEGKRCLQGRASGTYLRNRIERAFIAGIETAEAVTENTVNSVFSVAKKGLK